MAISPMGRARTQLAVFMKIQCHDVTTSIFLRLRPGPVFSHFPGMTGGMAGKMSSVAAIMIKDLDFVLNTLYYWPGTLLCKGEDIALI